MYAYLPIKIRIPAAIARIASIMAGIGVNKLTPYKIRKIARRIIPILLLNLMVNLRIQGFKHIDSLYLKDLNSCLVFFVIMPGLYYIPMCCILHILGIGSSGEITRNNIRTSIPILDTFGTNRSGCNTADCASKIFPRHS